MIAVFSKTERDLHGIKLFPKHLFKRIRTVQDIRGVKFTGVLLARPLYMIDSLQMLEAWDALNYFQPELFKKEK